MRTSKTAGLLLSFLLLSAAAGAQTTTVSGPVHDQTGPPLPGVTIELTPPHGAPTATTTDAVGRYQLTGLMPGTYILSFRLVNFADQRREFGVAAGRSLTVDAVLDRKRK